MWKSYLPFALKTFRAAEICTAFPGTIHNGKQPSDILTTLEILILLKQAYLKNLQLAYNLHVNTGLDLV